MWKCNYYRHACRKGRIKIYAFVSKLLHNVFFLNSYNSGALLSCSWCMLQKCRREMPSCLKREVEWTLKFTWGCFFFLQTWWNSCLQTWRNWEKTPGAYFVSHCFTLPEGNCNDCIRENDRSVEGKLYCYFLNHLYSGKKSNANFLNFLRGFNWLV